MKPPLLLAGLVLLLASFLWEECATRIIPVRTSGETSLSKIDFHTHYTHPRGYLIPLLDAWNMKAVVVDVVLDPKRTNWQAMVAHRDRYPHHLLLCTSFDISRIDEPDFVERAIEGLEHDLKGGARIVKVWKDVGMVLRDSSGSFIQVDDPRLQPVWDYLTEREIPVLAHLADPRAAWLPLDSASPHYQYYANHPEYHAYLHPELPRWETILEARDRWLERNPNLTVVGAHFGSMAYDVSEVARRLDRFPNFYVDTSARFADLALQESDSVRSFFLAYQDRILFGSDLMTWDEEESRLTGEQLARERAMAVSYYEGSWDYLTRADSMTYTRPGTSFRTPTRGLGLPRSVIEKIYYRNAIRLLKLDPPV